MSTAMWVQSVLIGAAVAWSALSAARRFLPVTSRRAQAAVWAHIDRPSMPAWLRAYARRAAPRSTSGAGCGDGCSSCGGCAAASSRPSSDAQPLVFRPRARS